MPMWDGAQQSAAGAYIENAYVIGYSVIEPGAVLSHVRVCDRHVPADTVLHGTRTDRWKICCRDIWGRR